MRKLSKKLLFWTDDFDKYAWEFRKKKIEKGNYYYDKNSNYLKFECDIIPHIRYLDNRKRYDAVLIDYGLLDTIKSGDGDSEKSVKELNIEFLQDCFTRGIKLAFVGGLCGKYCEDAKRVFPKLRFLHNIPESSTRTEEILYLLYNLFEKQEGGRTSSRR